MDKDLSFLNNKIIAHRGYHNIKKSIPENSLKAFERAIENGFGIEIDLHLLKDGKIAVMHDDTTERLTGINKLIKDCTYEDIKDLKLGNTNEGIPLFEEVLDLVSGRVPLLIEYKYDNKAGKLEEKSMELLKDYKGNFAVQSFNPASVKWFKDNYEKIPRGQLSSGYVDEKMCFIKKYILKNVLLFSYNKPDFISYAIKGLPTKRIDQLKEKGVFLTGWTVRTKEEYEFAKNYCNCIVAENMDDYIDVNTKLTLHN